MVDFGVKPLPPGAAGYTQFEGRTVAAKWFTTHGEQKHWNINMGARLPQTCTKKRVLRYAGRRTQFTQHFLCGGVFLHLTNVLSPVLLAA